MKWNKKEIKQRVRDGEGCWVLKAVFEIAATADSDDDVDDDEAAVVE